MECRLHQWFQMAFDDHLRNAIGDRGQRRISVVLVLCHHGPDRSCHLVGKRNRNQHERLTV